MSREFRMALAVMLPPIILVFICLHYPVILEVLFTIPVVLAPTVGLAWLVFRRCKFTLGQLMASLILFGAAMALASRMDIDRNYEPRSFAIMFVPTIGVGMFLGARAALKSAPTDQLRRWGYFLSGLLLPISFVALVWFFSHAPNWQFMLVMDFVLFGVTFLTLIHCISMKSHDMKQPDRVIPKICPDQA